MRKTLALLLAVAFVVAVVIAQDKTAPKETPEAKKTEKVQSAGCCGMEMAAKKQACPEGKEACKGGKECCKTGAAAGKSCCAEKASAKAPKPSTKTAPKKGT